MKSPFRSRNGVAAVEAAVCLPVLAAIIFGAIEVSGGIFHEYNAQAASYELAKVALRAESTCQDVQEMAAQLLPPNGFNEYQIEIAVVERTVNQDSVATPATLAFSIPQSGPAPVGLNEVPRGTFLRLDLTVKRPKQLGFLQGFFGDDIGSDSVFVKEF